MGCVRRPQRNRARRPHCVGSVMVEVRLTAPSRTRRRCRVLSLRGLVAAIAGGRLLSVPARNAKSLLSGWRGVRQAGCGASCAPPETCRAGDERGAVGGEEGESPANAGSPGTFCNGTWWRADLAALRPCTAGERIWFDNRGCSWEHKGNTHIIASVPHDISRVPVSIRKKEWQRNSSFCNFRFDIAMPRPRASSRRRLATALGS
jgi:hypothetical protein